MSEKIIQTFRKVILSGQFILGQEVLKFEKEVSAFYKTKYAVGVNSGTDALWLSLKALGIKNGDEVITTPFTFVSPSEVIAQCGARPVFVDINYNDFLINVKEIEKAITKKTKAIIPVHLFGQCCDMDGIMKLARKYNLKVIEDGAQAFGNMKIGKGDLLCFSFHPSKSLGACGDGGMVLTDNLEHYKILQSLRNHGADLSKGKLGKYHNLRIGFNSRLDEIQAAILRVKLKDFGKGGIKRLYTFRVDEKIRNRFVKQLEKMGLDVKIYYSKLLHLLPVFKYLGYKKGDFPIAEQSAKECLTVNVYD